LIQKLSASLSRRSLVGGPLGAAVLAAVGLGGDALAKKGAHTEGKKHKTGVEACIATGKKCSSKKPRKPSCKNPAASPTQSRLITCKNC